MRGARRSDGGWTFVSNHFLVLLCIAEDPEQRMVDVSRRLGITERAVQGIVADLVDAGYLTRTKVGRRNHYRVNASMPMRHLETEHRQLGDLLAILKHTTSGPASSRKSLRTGRAGGQGFEPWRDSRP